MQAHKGELQHLERSKRILPAGLGRTLRTWEKLYNEYHQRFGCTPELMDHLMKMKEAILLRAEIAQNFDQALEWDLQKLEKEIEVYGNKGEAADFQTSNAALSKFMGHNINTRTTSVSEWYGMRNLMEVAAKEAIKRAAQNG